MLTLSTRGDLAGYFNTFAKRATFAGIVALSRTGAAVKKGLREEMERVFDRPTRWTLNSLYHSRATSDRPVSIVWLKDKAYKSTDAEHYLGPQILGGARRDKRSERLLRQSGLLPAGMQMVPGAGARLDRYGNMQRGQLIALLSYLRVFNAAGFTMNRSFDPAAKRRGKWRRHEWFAISKEGGNLPPGVYLTDARSAQAVPVLRFVTAPSYRQRFDFFGVAGRIVNETLPRELSRALAEGYWRPRN